jgi:hypothetical protein
MYASNGSTKRLLPPASSSESTDPQEPSASKIEIVELLLSYGTDATLCNWGGLSAIDIASDTGQKDVFELLSARVKIKSSARNRRTDKNSSPKGVSATNAASLMTSSNSTGQNKYSDGDDELNDSSDKKDWFGRMVKGKKQSGVNSGTFDEVQPAQFTQPVFAKKHREKEDDFGGHRSSSSQVLLIINI